MLRAIRVQNDVKGREVLGFRSEVVLWFSIPLRRQYITRLSQCLLLCIISCKNYSLSHDIKHELRL